MITEQALQEAIAEVQGKRNPNRDDCMMLAAFYIIQERLYPEERPSYSYASENPIEARAEQIGEYGDSDFLQAIRGKPLEDVLSVMDELMETLKIIHGRLYDGVMRQLTE